LKNSHSYRLTLEPNDTHRLASLCGQYDEHLRQIEKRLDIQIKNRGNAFQVSGAQSKVKVASELLTQLYEETNFCNPLTPSLVHLFLQESGIEALMDETTSAKKSVEDSPLVRIKKTTIKPRGLNQEHYVNSIKLYDINFASGPAGTGKTYLAVACAVEALEQDLVKRILLVRPAVEAGEKLGFLPGDLSQKIDPYLRPLYDALYEMIGFDTVAKLIERNIIEVAPLAYMRGRTLNNSYIILDESQNTTKEQMKMFLTRIGFGSKAVITGDTTQIDLPRGVKSGLIHASEVLKNVEGIGVTIFQSKDVVRHPLVLRIVEAYDEYENAPKTISLLNGKDAE